MRFKILIGSLLCSLALISGCKTPPSIIHVGECEHGVVGVENVNDAKHGDVLILRTPGKPLPTHVAILAKGQNEMTLIHSIQISKDRKTVEEPFRRWERLVTHAFKFREIED